MLWSFNFSHPPKLRDSVFFFRIQVLRYIIPLRLVNICRRYGKLQCLRFHGQEVPSVRNVCKGCPVDTTVHPRTLEPSATPPQQHQISQLTGCFIILCSTPPPPRKRHFRLWVCETFLSLSEKTRVVKLNIMLKKKCYMHMVALPS